MTILSKNCFSQRRNANDVLSLAAASQNSQTLIGHQKSELANKIIHAIGDIIRNFDGKVPHINYSHIISEKLNYSYNYLTTVFAEVKGITIETFIIFTKVERVKELILGSNLTFTQIADHLHYSSVSHLSNQFKRVIGITPSQFRKNKDKGR